MTFGESVGSGFRNYVNFGTRASRSEYWYWVLFGFVLGFAAGIVDLIVFPGVEYGVLGVIVGLALILPGLAVSVRRLHDRDYSGWWLLLIFVPLIGAVILIVWFCLRGTDGPNRFGPNPLQQGM